MSTQYAFNAIMPCNLIIGQYSKMMRIFSFLQSPEKLGGNMGIWVRPKLINLLWKWQ